MTRRKLKYLGKTANGVPVFDRFNSHFEDHGFSKKVMREALSMVIQKSQFETHVVKMGRIIGGCSCVAVTEEDKIVQVVRKKRIGSTPMVLNRQPEPCESIFLILKKVCDSEGEFFILITAFVGEGSEPEPWDKRLKPGSEEHKRSVEF